MSKLRKKVLFFIVGPVPSDADREAAAKYEGNRFQLCYRNSVHVHPDEACEDFDILDGVVPANYQTVADEKPAEDAVEAPKADAGGAEGANVPPESPLKAQGGDTGGDGKPAAETKPKAPKPDAAKGWKPNA